MSLTEKDLEAERKEHVSVYTMSPETMRWRQKVSFDEKSYGGRHDRINSDDAVYPANDSLGPASSPVERDDKETRRIIRKIDLRLLPTLAVIYAFALIDRVNLPNVLHILSRPCMPYTDSPFRRVSQAWMRTWVFPSAPATRSSP